MRVGINLQELRPNRKYSQEELAHRAGIHQTYLSELESRKRNPTISVLDRLARAINVDIRELFVPRGKS